MAYRPRSFLSLAECPETDPPLGDTLPAASRADRPVNLLSDAAVAELIQCAKRTERLREVTVHTGGRPPHITYASYLASGGQSQFNVSRQHCPTAHAEMLNDARERNPGRLLSPGQQLKINMAQLVWRDLHRTDEGHCRKLPIALEVSHQAEAYHAAGLFPGGLYSVGYKVEVSNLETAEVNESRKLCRELGLMWRKGGIGEIIPVSERQSYRGPTCCPHAAFGVPCYAPYPEGEAEASLETPEKRRGKRSRTGRGSLEGTAEVGGTGKKGKAKVESDGRNLLSYFSPTA